MASGELYPVNNRADGIVFQLNPETISRSRVPRYADAIAAAADYWQAYNGPSPLQWVNNPPEAISFELLLYAQGTATVEADLAKLRKMMSKASRNPRGQSPEPPDLIFKYGNRSDTVKITHHQVTEERHTARLEVQQARVKLELKTVKVGGR